MTNPAEFFKTRYDLREVVKTKDALKAIQTLHRYFSQSAIVTPSCMMEYLGKNFADAIREDPFKNEECNETYC